MAKMARGHADDLASAILLAADRPILLAPAMNPLMWNNAATRRNVLQLRRDGVHMIGPNAGEMAEANEAGVGPDVRGDRNRGRRRRHSPPAATAPARGQARADHRRDRRMRRSTPCAISPTAPPASRALPLPPPRRPPAPMSRWSPARSNCAIPPASPSSGVGDGARHAASGGSRAAGRYRDLRRRRRRLARRQ